MPEPAAPLPVTSVAPEVLDRGDEDEIVAGILRRAELEDVAGGAPELYDQPSTSAYRSLAQSRGLDLADVVTAAVRGTLADVVRRPPVVTDPPDLAPAGPDSTSEGDRDV